MTDFEWIDDYFAGRLSPVERHNFETALTDHASLPESVAFYLLARRIAQQESNRIAKPLLIHRPIFRQVVTAAASLVAILGFFWMIWVWKTPVSPTNLADQYVQKRYSQFPISLDSATDSLKTACHFYNQGNWEAADAVFKTILQQQPNQAEALKFAGIVSLRRRKYDQAIDYFHRLGRQTDLYSNPGVFLEAIANLKRGQPMDKNRAKNLLHTVIQDNLEGKDEAEQLIERLQHN
ncbi:tetratricopeptide repeat protein [Larkinella terrae]|uniref:Tetratricopeptide repeat protein n=1 Tax=Larkinella terrae TaxID=2025311 RepID=A0A7K0EL87_9BACT|nr:hypothetical protein [Larkinella terrae]MRS62613.1 hypothetical protein [Larkinella terrae]